MNIEAVLLTGGASSRMGEDKATINVDGMPLALRIALGLAECGLPVTVLGREPIADFPFLQDEADYQGPLMALSRFQPAHPTVFVVSCDLPMFNPDIVRGLNDCLEGYDAVVPEIEGRIQPLVALYRATTFKKIAECVAESKRSMMAWLDRMKVRTVTPEELSMNSTAFQSANTPDELSNLLRNQG